MTVRVKLVTDSAADLPREWIERYDIQVVPAFVNFGEESYPDDGVAITREEFYKRLANPNPPASTSAMPPGPVAAAMSRQLEKAEHVVALTLASQFSSVYNTVRLAAEQVDPRRVTVYDTGSASLGEGWQVLAAAEAAEQGADVEGVLRAIRSTRQRTKFLVAVTTLEYLRRSGRINYVIASLGTILQIKPIIDVVDGKVTTVARVRTMSKAVQHLIEMIRGIAPFERLAVLHTFYPEGAEELRRSLSDVTPANNTVVIDACTAIGVHIGPGSLAICAVRAE